MAVTRWGVSDGDLWKKTASGITPAGENTAVVITDIGFPATHQLGPLDDSLGRDPRILIVGESILNSWGASPSFQSRLLTAYPNCIPHFLTYGGSESPVGMMSLAGSTLVYVDSANLFPSTNIVGSWGGGGLTKANSTFPGTGRPCTLLTGTSTVGQATVGGPCIVPAGPPGALTFSILAQPGTTRSFRLIIRNVTTATSILERYFSVGANNLADTVKRYSITVTTGYAAGNEITAYIYPDYDGVTHGAGTLYVAEPMFNAGYAPAEYRSLTGTPSDLGWVQAPDGLPVEYDLAIIQFGRNDGNDGLLAADHYDMLCGMIGGAYKRAKRVLVMTPPPQALANLSAWAAADLYIDNGLQAAARRAAKRYGCGFYDAVTDFKALVTSGAKTIADLMADAYHPKGTALGLDGMDCYLQAVLDYTSGSNSAFALGGGTTPSVKLMGEVGSGAWDWQPYTSPAENPAQLISTAQSTGAIWAMGSTEVGAVLNFTGIRGRTIGIVVLVDASAGGSATVTLDGHSAKTVSFTQAGLTMYPHGVFLWGGLTDKEHTVAVAVASGTVRVIGVVSC